MRGVTSDSFTFTLPPYVRLSFIRALVYSLSYDFYQQLCFVLVGAYTHILLLKGDGYVVILFEILNLKCL